MSDSDGPTISPELQVMCGEAGARLGVPSDVHPEDFIFQYLLEHPLLQDPGDAVNYYFEDGAKSANKLANLLRDHGVDPQSKFRLLEFASGFGCVTRHLARALPAAQIVSCDIHTEAVDFVERRLGTATLLSHSVPEELESRVKYDVIFALSFFSHMPRSTWGRWLSALESLLTKDGVLVFTTHGVASIRQQPAGTRFDEDGFLFFPASEQKDLDTAEYGSTFVTPTFVLREAATLDLKARFVQFTEAAWWEHQDLYVMSRR